MNERDIHGMGNTVGAGLGIVFSQGALPGVVFVALVHILSFDRASAAG